MQAACVQRGREGLTLGVALLLLGLLFSFERLGLYDLGGIWDWWPLVPIALGLAKVVAWASAEGVGSGVMEAFFGVWFLTAVHGWQGLHWSDSWPLALVAIGAGTVTRALLEPLFEGRSPQAPAPGVEPHA